MPRTGVVTALLLGFCILLGAQTVDSIRFEPAQQPLPDAEIRSLIRVKEATEATPQQIRQSIEALYRTNRFEQIVVERDESRAGFHLVFRTTPNWFVGRVAIIGAPDPPSTGQMSNATKLELGQEFSSGQLNQAVESMEATLRLNGFYEAKIENTVERDAQTGSVKVVFRVLPGPHARFAPPKLTGELMMSTGRLYRTTNWQRWWGLFGWKTVTEARVQNGLQRVRQLYLKKNYLMARALLDGMEYQPKPKTVTPSLRLEAGPEVNIEVTGAKVSKGRLRQLIPVYQEQNVDRSLLIEGARNLESYFQSSGYFDAEADFTIRDGVNGGSGLSRTVEFQLTRGDRYKLSHLEITGHKYFKTRELRDRLQTTPATPIRYRQGRYSTQMLEDDKQTIRDLYRSNGFLDTEVTSRIEENYRGKDRHQAVFLSVNEGEQWLVSGVAVDGVATERLEYLQSLLQTQVDQPYSEQSIGSDRETLLNTYYNNGFPQAAVDTEVTPEPATKRMKVKFTVQEGRQQFVRKVLVEGLGSTDPQLVYRRLQIADGDPISQSAMLDTQRRLTDLGIFARVDMAVQNPEGVEPSKYILYQLEEARKYSVNFGFGAEIARIGGGITSFDSPAGGTGFSPRVSFGVSRANFFGVGHTAGLQTRLSNIQRRALANYLAPRFRSSDNLNLTFTGLFDDSRNVRTFNARRWEASAQLGQRLTRANTIQYRLTYRRVSVDQSTLKITPGLIPLLSQPVRLGIASVTFIQDRRDDPLDSKRGWYNTVDAAIATRQLTSESDFLRVLGRNSSYWKVGRDMVLARTLTFGWQYAFTDNPSRDVPLPERFYSGGANSHRAFAENQAGPRDLVTGFPIGGKALLINSVELRFPLVGDNLSAVLYHDSGNVYSRLNKLSLRWSQKDLSDFDYMVHTLGIGVRYRTPVGPIRFDIGYSPNSPQFNGFQGTREDLLFGRGVLTNQRVNQIQFHLSLGQAF